LECATTGCCLLTEKGQNQVAANRQQENRDLSSVNGLHTRPVLLALAPAGPERMVNGVDQWF